MTDKVRKASKIRRKSKSSTKQKVKTSNKMIAVKAKKLIGGNGAIGLTSNKDKFQLEVNDISTAADIGKRDYMEDRIYHSYVNNRFFCAFCFDGHQSEHAAEFLANRFETDLPIVLNSNLPHKDIPFIFTKMIQRLSDEYKASGNDDGSTISGVIVDLQNGIINVCNIGDSQVLICGLGGKKIFVSERDACDLPHERERLSDLGITIKKEDTWRLPGGLNMTKAFADFTGDELEKALDSSGRSPSVTQIRLPQKCGTIIIATDGLWDDLSTDVIASSPFFRKKNALELVEIAKTGMKGDNISIIKFSLKNK